MTDDDARLKAMNRRRMMREIERKKREQAIPMPPIRDNLDNRPRVSGAENRDEKTENEFSLSIK